MIMNMLAGAHAALIPLITALHDEAETISQDDIPRILSKIDRIFSYEAEGWVQNMAVDLIIDFFHKLPEEIARAICANIQMHDHIPLRFCLFVMDKNHEAAVNIIEKTDVLDETDLLYRIQSGQMHEMMAVARRKNLSLDVLSALIESHKPEVYIELLNNPCLKIQEEVRRHLQEVAEHSPKKAWVAATSNIGSVMAEARIV